MAVTEALLGSVAQWFGANADGLTSSIPRCDDNYVCLVESNKLQIKSLNNARTKNSETKVTRKRVWIRPMHSAAVILQNVTDVIILHRLVSTQLLLMNAIVELRREGIKPLLDCEVTIC